MDGGSVMAGGSQQWHFDIFVQPKCWSVIPRYIYKSKSRAILLFRINLFISKEIFDFPHKGTTVGATLLNLMPTKSTGIVQKCTTLVLNL